MPKKVKIDLKDRKILRELDMNARIPMNKLAKKVGLSRQLVQYRINRMKKNGIIGYVVAIFDSVVLGKRWYRIVFQLKKIDKEEKQRFIEYFKKYKNIFWLGEVGGNWDFVINFITDDQYTFNKLFEKILEDWENVIQRYEILVYVNVRDQERKYILEDYETEKTYMFHEMKYNPKVKIDEIDKKIILLLSKNAWLSASDIGLKLNINYKTVQNRIKNLEKNKVILGYRVSIHASALGYEANMIFLKIHRHKPELEKKLYEFLKHPNITFLVKHLSTWRIGMEVETRDRFEFQKFLVELRTMFGDIISEYETFPIFYDHVFNYFPEGALE